MQPRTCFAVRVATAVAALLVATASAGAQERAPLRFVVLGHLRGDLDGERLSYLPELVASVRRDRPDLVFLCGDLIYGDEHGDGPADPAVIRADWEALDAALAGIGAPIHRVPGNHDVSDLTTRDVWRERYGELPKSVVHGGARFLLLNSTWTPKDGDRRKAPPSTARGVPLGKAQLQFLDRELKAAAPHEPVFLLLHHVLWREPDAVWWSDVAPRFVGSPVRAVFAGDCDAAKFSFMERGGVSYVQTAMVNFSPRPKLRAHEALVGRAKQFDHYVVVDVDGSDVRMDVRVVGAFTPDRFPPSTTAASPAGDDPGDGDATGLPARVRDFVRTREGFVVALASLAVACFLAGALAASIFGRLRRRRVA